MATTSTADGVRFNATSTGTGDFVDATAVTGYRRGTGVLVDGALYRYRAENATLSEYERGWGIWTNGTSTLTRLFIEYSSNSGAKTSFTSVPQVAVTPGPDDLRSIAIPDGRLTLQSGVPVMTTSQSAKTSLFYTSAAGQSLPLFNGTQFKQADFLGELVALTTDTTKNPAAIGASKVNDWFAWEDTQTVTVTIASPGVFTLTNHGLQLNHPVLLGTNGALPTGLSPNTVYYVKTVPTASTFTLSATPGGSVINTTGTQSGVHTIYTVRLTHGPDWTNDTTPSAGTALVMVNGWLLNSVAITNGPAAQRGTYLGTTRSDVSSQLDWIPGYLASGGGPAFFGVWNMYNRVDVATSVRDSDDSWPYATATWRPYNNSAGNRVQYVYGRNEDCVTAEMAAMAQTSGGGVYGAVGIGVDVTNNYSGSTGIGQIGGVTNQPIGKYSGNPGAGFHFLSAVEYASGATATFYGDVGIPGALQSGLHVTLRM